MITDAELTQYEDEGAVLIDSPFTTTELDRAEAGWDRLLAVPGTPVFEEPDFLELF